MTTISHQFQCAGPWLIPSAADNSTNIINQLELPAGRLMVVVVRFDPVPTAHADRPVPGDIDTEDHIHRGEN